MKHLVLGALLAALLIGPAHSAVVASPQAYAKEVLGGNNEIELLQALGKEGAVLGVAHTAYASQIERCCPSLTISLGAKQGILFFGRRLDGGRIELLDHSPTFALSAGGGHRRDGGSITAVAFQSNDRFNVRIEQDNNGSGASVLFRFARRRGNWVVSGYDKAAWGSVGTRAPTVGVVSRVSHNLLTGERVERKYRANAAQDEMLITETLRTHRAPIRVLLSEFDPSLRAIGALE